MEALFIEPKEGSRGTPAVTGKFTLTILEVVPTSLLETTDDTSNCCEDCPEVNEYPPPQSDCPFFVARAGERPECIRDKFPSEIQRNLLKGT